MLSIRHIHKIIYPATLSLLLNACAIHSDRTGRFRLDVDEAMFLGSRSEKFHVPNAGQATLRVMDGEYSIKLEDRFQVIPIGKADRVEIRSLLPLGDRSLIIVTKSESACRYTTQLIAIRGFEALSWDFGDCANIPAIGKKGDTLFFDFPQESGGPIRSTYRNGVFVNGFGVDKPASNPQTIISGAPRYQPEPPDEPELTDRPSSNKDAFSASSSAQKLARRTQINDKAKTSASILAKPLDFPAKEQKPIRIILDN